MIEARALIKDIDQTRQQLLNLGATFDSYYSFKDLIFVPLRKPYNLSDDFLRARVYGDGTVSDAKVVLIRKQTDFHDVGKTDQVKLKKEFATEAEAIVFVTTEFADQFQPGFSYSRNGWQYNLGTAKIFVEDIEHWQPSIEVEAATADELTSILTTLGTTQTITASMPEVMAKILLPKE